MQDWAKQWAQFWSVKISGEIHRNSLSHEIQIPLSLQKNNLFRVSQERWHFFLKLAGHE